MRCSRRLRGAQGPTHRSEQQLRHDGVRKTFLLKWQKLPIHSIASIAMHCNSGIARECKIATDSTRRHKEHKEKPSFWSEQDLFVGAMTKPSEISVKHFEHFEQSGRETNLEKQVLNCQTMKFTVIGGDLREYLQTIRPIVYHPYY